MTGPLLTLTTESRDGVAVIHVDGELDLSSVDDFDAELEQVLGTNVVVDLVRCTFIDSSALRALVRAQKQVRAASNAELALVAPAQPARRVLEIASLDRFVPVFATVDEAVTSFA